MACTSNPATLSKPNLPVLEAGLAYHQAGLFVLPTAPGQKHSTVAWKEKYAVPGIRPDEETTAKMLKHAHGLCIVCGPLSGQVECIDFDDGGSAWPDWSAVIPKSLFERLVIEQTPSGGFHVAYRCPDAALVDNTSKLAKDEAGRCLIETRGTGAVFLCDPSSGYHLIQGCFTSLPVLTPDERDVLLNTAVALDCFVAKPVTAPVASIPVMVGNDVPAYIRAVLDGECAKVASAVEGSRNDTLNVAAVKVGHYLGAFLSFEPTARAALTTAALSCGLEPGEVAATIDSGFRKGMAEPKTLPAKTEAPLVDVSALLAKAGCHAPPHVEAGDPETNPGWRMLFMNDVSHQPVRWLWPGRIALGKLNMLIGDPGLGKSFVTCDLAARVSTGAPWPDGAPNDGPGGVLLLNAEDDKADTIRPRLDAARADVSRIAVLDAVSGDHRLLSLAKHADVLVQCAAQVPNLKLIVVDPVSAFLGGIDSHKNTDVREVLAPLSALAEQIGAAILAVSHLSKGVGQAVYRAIGSLAFTAASRSVWAIAKDKNDRGRRLFLPVKNNLGDDKTGLAFSINGFSATPFVDWEADAVDADIDEMLNPQFRAVPRASAKAAIDEWLEVFLANGERPVAEVNEAGKAAGFSEKQLQRARVRIGVRLHRVGMPARIVWRLDGDEANESAEASPEKQLSAAPAPATSAPATNPLRPKAPLYV